MQGTIDMSLRFDPEIERTARRIWKETTASKQRQEPRPIREVMEGNHGNFGDNGPKVVGATEKRTLETAIPNRMGCI